MRRLRLVFFVPLLLALVLEGGARLAEPSLTLRWRPLYDRRFPATLLQADPVFAWSGRPRVSAALRNSEGDNISYELNTNGWRAPEFSPQVTPINGLFLGGDPTFGAGVAVEARFPERIASLFPGLKVWSLGMPGYAPDQLFLQAQRWLPVYPFTFVVLELGAGDLEAIAGHTWAHLQPGGLPGAVAEADERALFSPISEAWNLFAYAALQPRYSASQLAAARANALHCVGAIVQLAQQRATPLAVVWSGARQGVTVESSAVADYARGLRLLADYSHFVYIDGDALNASADFLPAPDGHWSSVGHGEIANQLAPFVRAQLERVLVQLKSLEKTQAPEEAAGSEEGALSYLQYADLKSIAPRAAASRYESARRSCR